MDKISGIYCIENIVKHKRYIGQSVDINRRKYEHIHSLSNNKHLNAYLQRSWNEYGEENFKFSILELCNKSQLKSREVYWIEFYDSFNNGYNMTLGGDDNPMNYQECRTKLSESLKGNKIWLGKKHKEETKIKISLGNKGKFVSAETRKKLSIAKSKPNGRVGKLSVLSKPIKQINKNTKEVIKIFESISQAEISINGKRTGAINNCLKGNSKSAFGYIWEYC